MPVLRETHVCLQVQTPRMERETPRRLRASPATAGEPLCACVARGPRPPVTPTGWAPLRQGSSSENGWYALPASVDLLFRKDTLACGASFSRRRAASTPREKSNSGRCSVILCLWKQVLRSLLLLRGVRARGAGIVSVAKKSDPARAHPAFRDLRVPGRRC